MTKSGDESTGARTCQFPLRDDTACGRPIATGRRGRPSRYCDDPAHTRAAAWRARRAHSDQGDGPSGEHHLDVALVPPEQLRDRTQEQLDDARAEIRLLRQQLADVTAERDLERLGRLRAEQDELVASTHWARAEEQAGRARDALENRERQLRNQGVPTALQATPS